MTEQPRRSVAQPTCASCATPLSPWPVASCACFLAARERRPPLRRTAFRMRAPTRRRSSDGGALFRGRTSALPLGLPPRGPALLGGTGDRSSALGAHLPGLWGLPCRSTPSPTGQGCDARSQVAQLTL